MRISIIVAAAENGVIGNGGRMPWRLPSDMKRLRALTMGKPLVMGRKTFGSLPRALDGRDNIVVTRAAGWTAPGALVEATLEAALATGRRLAEARGIDEVIVFGGGEIYAAALPQTDRVYLTRVHASPPGDARFPALDPADWRLIREEALPRGEQDEHAATFQIWERMRPGL